MSCWRSASELSTLGTWFRSVTRQVTGHATDCRPPPAPGTDDIVLRLQPGAPLPRRLEVARSAVLRRLEARMVGIILVGLIFGGLILLTGLVVCALALLTGHVVRSVVGGSEH